MRKRVVLAAFSLVSLLIVSCLSNVYKDVGIQIATNAQLVAGMRFVNGWTVYKSQLYTAYGVGVKEADRLAGRGVRNVTLLR